MAKHVILESYTFTPSTRTITVVGKNIRREQLLLITNTTANTVIYNFSDPDLKATSYTNAADTVTGQETTTIILAYNTTAMSSTDKLSIMVEETFTEISPSETMRDPVDKLRVSNPQSLIDTDFEYGTQPTKWETVNLVNNRPSAFFDATSPVTGITNVTASGKTVTIAGSGFTVAAGQPFFITGTLDTAYVDGWWIADTASSSSITFLVNTAPATALWDADKTYVFPGNFFTGAGIPLTSITVAGTTTVTVTSSQAHGLRVGNSVYIRGTTGVAGVNGTWQVATTPSNSVFTFIANGAVSGTVTLAAGATATAYVRANGYTEHRPFDGGVQFSNETPYHGSQIIRQTRRYFRYQSGKGLQFSTGSVLKPPLYVDNVTSSGTTVTVTTRYPHGLLPGSVVKVIGATETAYNGNFTVVTAANPITFTYTALSTPSATPATGFPITISPFSWYGGSNRVGMFDNQNGFYFEYDGQTLYAVRRSSTAQLSGRVSVTNGSNSVTGVATKFSSQLKPGDYIVIRGMSYVVNIITSDTQMYIGPEYRGSNSTNCAASKTINVRYPQSSWNMDKMDGTGSSLINLDLTKMQMFYMDYTWYGAGAIRFGFKNNRGEVVYCHRIPNSNINTEAYMRTGNLPARYETNTIAYQTFATAWGIGASTGVVNVADTTGWPASGTVAVYAPAATGGAIEYMTYSSKTTTSLTINARAQAGGTSATAFTYSATAPLLVELYSPQTASTISHWGSSVIMDGRFDDDKSFVFQGGMNTAISNIGAGVRSALISIRLSPTVDNGLTGLLGAREIINRMQLTLRSMGAYVTGSAMAFRIELVLNGRASAGSFTNVGGSSLAQVCLHGAGTTISGGETIFSFFVSSGGSVTSQDLSIVRDLGNSILGGGSSLTVPTTVNGVYPDGPDVVTICATNVTAVTTNSINARISWTEAQA